MRRALHQIRTAAITFWSRFKRGLLRGCVSAIGERTNDQSCHRRCSAFLHVCFRHWHRDRCCKFAHLTAGECVSGACKFDVRVTSPCSEDGMLEDYSGIGSAFTMSTQSKNTFIPARAANAGWRLADCKRASSSDYINPVRCGFVLPRNRQGSPRSPEIRHVIIVRETVHAGATPDRC